MDSGKAVYIEGVDFAKDHHNYNLFNYFGCNYVHDGYSANVHYLIGVDGTFAENYQFNYQYDSDSDYSVDEISADEGTIFFTSQEGKGRGVCYDGGGQYRTIFTSTLLGAMINGVGNNTKANLMTEYLSYLTSPPGTIEGTVTLNGGSGNIEEVVVTTGGAATNPDYSGYYTISVSPGTKDVTASLDGYRDSTIVGVEVFSNQVTGGIDFTLEVYNGPPDWEQISGTQYHMFLKAEITLEGEEFEGIGDNMAGAFCWIDSLECRGIATWQATGFWFFYIVSNVSIGEEITFMIYDSETDTIYNCNETIIFEDGTTIGTTSDPYQLTASYYSTDGDYPVLSTKLNPNFPNPFNHSTTISFGLKEKGDVKLTVYNIKGQLIETLIDHEMVPGIYEIPWDGKSGIKELANGIYLYKFETKNKTLINKMLLIR
ncbi:MAG: T9SS type A sorting domain-containing protein [Candidatus Cloacimonetes bacterium]|nr:T9SS type A sorting domain-containing protein [Candidatus Cloacimonadota bacterium]